MLTFSFIKMFLGRMIEFIANHWREIILCLILCAVFYYKTCYEATVEELALFKREIAELSAKQAHENEIKRVKAELAIKSSQLIHDKQIEDIRNAYAKSNKVTNLTIRDLRNRLREQLSSTFTLPPVEFNTPTTTEEWRDSYSTISKQYKTLTDACTITTLDYNLLRDWADTACTQVGCK